MLFYTFSILIFFFFLGGGGIGIVLLPLIVPLTVSLLFIIKLLLAEENP